MKNICLATFCLILASGAASAATCKSKPLRGNGNTVNPAAIVVSVTQARTYARQAWNSICTKRFGGVWCDHTKAQGARYICNRAPNGIGGYKNVCEFEGTPCRAN